MAQVLPYDLLERMCQSRHMFASSEALTQVFYALFDQRLHGEHPLKASPTGILAETQSEVTAIPYLPGTSWHLCFTHLFGYASALPGLLCGGCVWNAQPLRMLLCARFFFIRDANALRLADLLTGFGFRFCSPHFAEPAQLRGLLLHVPVVQGHCEPGLADALRRGAPQP